MKLQYLLFILLLAGCAPDQDDNFQPRTIYSGQTILLHIYTDIDSLPVKFTNDQSNLMSQLVNAPGYTYVYDNIMRGGEIIEAKVSVPDSGYIHFDLLINGQRVSGASGVYNGDSTFTSFKYLLP